MPRLTERISELETKLKQLKTRQQRIDARARAIASRRARKDDTGVTSRKGPLRTLRRGDR
jgi:phage shock protein A